MAFDRFSIVPFSTGLQTDTKPFLIMDDAFARLNNAYIFRGRVRKRFGSEWMGYGWTSIAQAPLFSRLRIALAGGAGVGTTDGAGAATGTVPGAIFKVGQEFSIGTQIYTVQATGAPVVMLTTGAGSGTYNTTTGVYVFAGAPINTQIYFYPAEPVMGLTVYESGPINNQPSYAFDTQFAYVFAGGFWNRSGTGTSPIWHGTNINFFWATNYRGATINVVTMFVTNFYVVNRNGAVNANDDPIWYTSDGSTWTAARFYVAPNGGAPNTGPYVVTSRLIVNFKGYLLLLNTVETDTAQANNISYINRVRWSNRGNPFAANAWYEPAQNGGFDNAAGVGNGAGFLPPPSEEAIVSCEFIKDRLIVFFERSTFELAFTGNGLQPFKWQKLNTELGCESQQSPVPFDKFVLAIGNTGVHACNGSNVERIDNKIPDQIFQISNKDVGVQRVAGIRDYFTEMVYWSFPSITQNSNEVYPSRVLVFNYKNGAWAFNDDCITAFGYFEQQIATTWASSAPLTWEEANQTWDSGVNATQFRQVIAGNQQGYVFIISSEISQNAAVMQITNMAIAGSRVNLTIIDHTLNAGDYIYIRDAQGVTGINNQIYKVQNLVAVAGDGGINTVSIIASFTGTYTGGGVVARVSNYGIMSKQWNPYGAIDSNVYLSKIDFGVMTTTDGQVTVEYYPSSSETGLVADGIQSGAIVGNNILETSPYALYPLEADQERVWHPVYFQGDGECIQIFISMSDEQIRTPAIAFEDFEIQGMILYTKKTADRME